jgi:CheY-like chemotaxis protein
MSFSSINVLLADDDEDDRNFFKEALEELPISANLTTVDDGVQLMQLLSQPEATSPDVLFLDLNMPRKNGFECLSEIKLNEKLKHLPVIIYSTSLDHKVVNSLYENGAHYYVRKPGDFSKLKEVINEALTKVAYSDRTKPPKEKFIIPG